MTTDETARLHLYEQARSTWDDEAARTFMTALPLDVDRFATKDDLETLKLQLEAKIESVATQTLRTMVLSMVTINATLVGLVLIGVQLS